LDPHGSNTPPSGSEFVLASQDARLHPQQVAGSLRWYLPLEFSQPEAMSLNFLCYHCFHPVFSPQLLNARHP
jgi:hypothetical protein